MGRRKQTIPETEQIIINPPAEEKVELIVAATKESNQIDIKKKIAQLDAELAQLTKHNTVGVSIDVMYEDEKISEVATVGKLLQISAKVFAWLNQLEIERKRYKQMHNGTVGALAGAELGELTNEGKTAEEWHAIFSKAISMLRNKVEIESRLAYKEELSKYLSEEDQLREKFNKLGEQYRILK